jgi:translocation and assembly module TamB
VLPKQIEVFAVVWSRRTPPARSTDRAPRRARRVWLLALACLLGLSGGVWALLQQPAVRTRLRAELRAAIRRELGLDASMASVSVSLPFAVVGERIYLVHPQHGMLASAARLEVAPSLFALLRGEFRLKRVVIEQAHVRLRVEDGKIVNLPELGSHEPDPGQSQRLPLRELIVRDASVEVDAAPAYRASLEQVQIALGVTGGTLLDLGARVGGGTFTHGEVREQIRALSLKGRVAPDKIQVERAQLDTTVFKLGMSQGFVSLPLLTAKYAGKVELETELEKLASLPLGVDLPPVSGHVALALRVSGQGRDFRAAGSFHGDNPLLDGFGFGTLDLNLEATPAGIKLLKGSRGRVVQDGGLVMLEGKVGFGPSVPLELSADIKHLDFHKLMAQLGVTEDCLVNWQLRGGFKIAGTAVPVDVTGPVWAESTHFQALDGPWHDPRSREVIGTPPGRVNGRVAVRPDALRFENLHAHLPHSEMHVNVHVGFEDKIGVTARSDNFDLRDATGLVGMAIGGHGGFTLDVGGTYDKTTLTGTLDLADFLLDEYRVGHLRTRAELEKGGLAVRFRESDVRKNDSHYVIDDMFLDFSRGFSIDAKARFDKLALSDFYHSVALDKDPVFAPYQGRLRGPAEVRYTRGFPGDAPSGTLTIGTELDVLDARLHGVAFQSGRLEAQWIWERIDQGTRGARLEVRNLRLVRGNGSLIGRGRMDPGGVLRMTVFGERLSLSNLEPLTKSGIDLAGELGLAGTVRGTPWVPEAQLDLALSGVRLNKRGLGDGSLKLYTTHREDPWLTRAAQIDADAASLDEPCVRARRAVAQANWAPSGVAPSGMKLPPAATLLCGSLFGGRVDLDVAVGTDPRLPLRGSIDFREIPPAWLLPDPRTREANVIGAVSGHVDLSDGFATDPDSLVGTMSLSSLRFGRDQAWLESDGPLRVALTGQGVRVERARFSGRGTKLRLSGGGSLRRGLGLELEGTFDLAVLPSLWPEVSQASGLLDLSVKVAGDVNDPSVFGHAHFEDGSLMLARYAQPLDELSARFSFSEHEILLDDLRAVLAGGELRAHGSAAISAQEIGRYELFMTAREVALEPMSGVEIAFSADTKLSGGKGLRIPELTGSVRLLRAVYKRPFSLGIAERLTGLSQAKRVERASYDPRKDHIAFDLRILDEAPIKVTNNLITAEFAVEDGEQPFRIVGTDQRTGVLGTLALTRGTMVFRNAQFLVESGTVTFLDETRVRPRLDVQARTEFRRTADSTGARWLITLHAYGETDNLKLDTTSDPALAREDIALLLTVGMTRAEANRLNTTALTQGAALEALASVTGVDREVKKALPVIDDFAVTTAYSPRTNKTEPQVVVGKRLSDRVRATATTGLTADSNFKTGVQWRLNNQASVEAGYDNIQTTTSSQFGNVGLDLRWRLEFD